jgi:hypothetical protein
VVRRDRGRCVGRVPQRTPRPGSPRRAPGQGRNPRGQRPRVPVLGAPPRGARRPLEGRTGSAGTPTVQPRGRTSVRRAAAPRGSVRRAGDGGHGSEDRVPRGPPPPRRCGADVARGSGSGQGPRPAPARAEGSA